MFCREELFVLVMMTAMGYCLYIETTDDCSANQEFLYCGSACPKNCSNQFAPIANCSDESGDNCVRGCFCKAGYLRNDIGDCVEKDKCFDVNPSDCADNEEFLECGSECPLTCTQPVAPASCPRTCVKGCFCKSGFVRDEFNDLCVTLDQCSGDNCFSPQEEFSLCSANCVPSCDDPRPVCTSECASGCVCKTGLYRDDSGICVSIDNCPVNMTRADFGLLASCLNFIDRILHS